MLYLAFPTKDFYWDGVGFALGVQHPERFGGMIEANHPLYIGFGWIVFSLARFVAPGLLALNLLQGLNSVLGAACVVMAYEIARQLFRDRVEAVLIAGMFALSATWWKFATDSNAYIPALLFLAIAARLLLPGHKARPLSVALLHACAMLFHELAVIFVVPAAIGIYWQCREDRLMAARKTLVYLATSGALTSAAYYTCFRLATGESGIANYLRWITGHTPDSAFSFAVGRSAWLTIRGTLRVAGGGAVNLFRSGPVGVAAVMAVLAAGTILVWRSGSGPDRKAAPQSASVLLWSWIAAYAAFLLFWMPQNTFYRLFYLLPLALLAGSALHRWGGRRTLFAAAGLLGAWNYLFYIHPHSLSESNTVLRAASAMKAEWKPGAWVYMGSFNADNWTLLCFNPQVMYKNLDATRLADVTAEMRTMRDEGHDTWIDRSAIDLLESGSGGKQWLTEHTRPGFDRDFSDAKHRVEFVRVFP
jgi:hypothetical protein